MKQKNNFGFTLIELIVSVSIIVILSGMSLAAYFKFSQNQTSVNDARSFSTYLRKVQSMAKNLVYPSGCSGLVGYRVTDDCVGVYGDDCKSLKYSAVCSGVDMPISGDKNVLQDAYFSGPVDVVFLAGTGKISSAKNFSIANINNIAISIDENGNIVTK